MVFVSAQANMRKGKKTRLIFDFVVSLVLGRAMVGIRSEKHRHNRLSRFKNQTVLFSPFLYWKAQTQWELFLYIFFFVCQRSYSKILHHHKLLLFVHFCMVSFLRERAERCWPHFKCWWQKSGFFFNFSYSFFYAFESKNSIKICR